MRRALNSHLLFILLAALTTPLSASDTVMSLASADEHRSSDKPPSAALATGHPGRWTAKKITQKKIRKAVKRLPKIIRSIMKKTGVPGVAVAVVQADRVLLTQGFGLREVGKPGKVDANTVFQLASVSKSVGATVVSRAVSKGLQLFSAFYVNPSLLANRERPTNPNPARPLADYTGIYQNDYFGPATVTVVEGELMIALGPTLQRYPLTHWSGDLFSYQPTGENAVGIAAITFRLGTQSVVIEDLNEFDLGTFTK